MPALKHMAAFLAPSSMAACASTQASRPDLSSWPEILPDFRVAALRVRMHEPGRAAAARARRSRPAALRSATCGGSGVDAGRLARKRGGGRPPRVYCRRPPLMTPDRTTNRPRRNEPSASPGDGGRLHRTGTSGRPDHQRIRCGTRRASSQLRSAAAGHARMGDRGAA
jgi:hypothetical protein